MPGDRAGRTRGRRRTRDSGRDRAAQPAVQARPAIRDLRRDRLGMGPTYFGGVAPLASRRRQLERRPIVGQFTLGLVPLNRYVEIGRLAWPPAKESCRRICCLAGRNAYSRRFQVEGLAACRGMAYLEIVVAED